MLILASNQPDQLDGVIKHQLDELIQFNLPGQPERLRMLKLYFSLYILDPPRVSWWKRPLWVYVHYGFNLLITPQLTCAVRVTVVIMYVSVCLSVR